MAETLKEKTAKGLFWGAMNSGATQVLNLAIGIFLARLLSPADYGMVGMLAIFSAIAGTLQESGFISAIVNLKKPTEKDYNAVFWFSLLMGLSLYALLFFCAPLIAGFFHQPELVWLSRFVFVSFVVAGTGTAYSAYMLKNMMNKEKAVIGVVALVTSGATGIALAYQGLAYWSLAWQQLVYIAVNNLGKLYYVRWLPSRHIDLSPVRRMFGFSSKILVTSMVNNVSNNLLSFLFGRLFPPRVLGHFTQAYKWDTMAYSFVSGTIAQVAQPIFVSVSDEQGRQLRVFRKMLRFTAFLSFPALLGLALVSREFILLTISDKWADSIILLQILCVGGAFFPFHTLYQNLTISSGRSDIYMWCNILLIATQLGSILLFHSYGIVWMVAAYSAVNILWLGVWQYFAHRLIGLCLLDVLKDLAPFLLAAMVTMGITYFLTRGIGNLAVLLLVRILVAALLYGAIMKLAGAKIMEECLGYLFSRSRKR